MRMLIPILLFSNLLVITVVAQEEGIEYPITSKTVFKDVDENVISFETFLEWTSGQDYNMEPIFDEDGNIKVIYVVSPSVQQNYRAERPQFVRSKKQRRYAAPDFDVRDLQGNGYQLSKLRDKVVVLKFWFTNCKPCITEIPELNQLVEDFKGQEVVFLAPTLDPAARMKSFLRHTPFGYQVLPDSRSLAHEFNVFGYPTHMVINREGMVEAIFVGVNTDIRELLSGAIQNALDGVEEELESPPPPTVAQQPDDKEVQTVNTTDVIKDENGNRLRFGQFLEMANSGQYRPVRRTDEAGESFILMKKKKVE